MSFLIQEPLPLGGLFSKDGAPAPVDSTIADQRPGARKEGGAHFPSPAQSPQAFLVSEQAAQSLGITVDP